MQSGFIEKFLDIASFDRIIISLKKNIRDLNTHIAKCNEEAHVLEQGLANAHEHHKEARKLVDRKESEIKDLDIKLKAVRTRVDGSRSQREYDASNTELSEYYKQQAKLEEELLHAWKNLESAQQLVAERKEQSHVRLDQLEVILGDYYSKLAEINKNLEQQEVIRQEKLKEIPPEIIEQYLLVYDKVENPLVPLHDSSCSVCFYSMPQHEIHAIKKGKILQCKDCFRFLYFKHES